MAESTRRVWVCELADCAHVWLAVAKLPPDKCAKCRRRGWHVTASTVELIRESGAGLDERIAEIARRVFAEEWASVPAEPVEFAEPEVLPSSRVDVAALRAICAGETRTPMATPTEPTLTPKVRALCSFETFNETDGEVYRCGLPAHDWKVKHAAWIKL